MDKNLKNFYTVCCNIKNGLPKQLIDESVNILNKKYSNIYKNSMFLFNMPHDKEGNLNDVLEDFLKAKHEYTIKNNKKPQYFVIERHFKDRLECTLAYLVFSNDINITLDELKIKKTVFGVKEIVFEEMFDLFCNESYN